MARSTTYKQDSKFWIALIDMMASILIVYLLVSFVDNILSPHNIEQAIIDQKRKEFIILLKREFNYEIDQKEIQLKEEFDHLQITFSDGVLFQTGEHELQYSGKNIIRRCAKIIQNYLSTHKSKDIETIQVEGHTDDIPLRRSKYPRNNWELSTARAIEVIDKFGDEKISSSFFSANGYEANRPISKRKESNRRIELKVFFSSKAIKN